jgi:hypothetical protein
MQRTDETPQTDAHAPGARTDHSPGTAGRPPTPAVLGARLARIHSQAETAPAPGDDVDVDEQVSPALH